MIFLALVTLPVNPSNGAENDSVQAFCVTFSVMPTSDGSQWSVISQLPLTSGQLLLPAPATFPLPALASELDSSEPHAPQIEPNMANTNKLRIIRRWYRARSVGSTAVTLP